MAYAHSGIISPPRIRVESDDLATADHELMIAVAFGDHGAFAELTSRHLKSMVALAQRMLGSAAEADEVTQEAFLRLWINAPQWDPDGPARVKTWLSRVVVNLCLDSQRRRKPASLDEVGEIEDPKQGAEDRVCEDEQNELLRAALLQLPERQKTAVILSYFEDLSGREIATIMGLSEGAVESLLVRARRKLRETVVKLGLTGEKDQ